MRYMRIFRQNFFVLYSKLKNIKISKQEETQALNYNRTSYKEILRLQIFLAENNISFIYTDTLSLSELIYLYSTLNEYLKEKNDAFEKIKNEG